MRCSMLSRMKLHRAVNVAGIVKRKDSFTTVRTIADVKTSTPPSEAIVSDIIDRRWTCNSSDDEGLNASISGGPVTLQNVKCPKCNRNTKTLLSV